MEYEAREKAVCDYNQAIFEAELRGEKRTTARINRLHSLLLQDKRYSDLEYATTDLDF